MKIYKGFCASPGLVLGQVSRLEHHVETTTVGPFKPSRELQLLTDAIRTAQDELESMADRAAPSEQAIFQFQSMMLDDEGMMNEVRFCINAGVGAAAAMNQVGQRYADQLANMKDNPYMQLRSVDILDATRRVINIITNRPRMWLALDHPVILAAERLMPTDLFSVPSGMILGIITAEGSGQSHAAIIARAMNIPGIVQVGRDFLDDCDGRTVILDATGGQCTLDPDAAARQQAETRICELQRENEEMGQLHALPNRTKDGQPFELLANCFGPEDIDTAMQSGAQGVGLLRTGYMMLPGRILDEQEQYFFYCSCLAAAQGRQVTVRTFDFGSDRTISDAYQGLQSSKLGLRGIRNSLRQPRQFETQLCALMRAAARGPLQVMFPMVTTVEDWDAAMRVVERCREHLAPEGVIVMDCSTPDVRFMVKTHGQEEAFTFPTSRGTVIKDYFLARYDFVRQVEEDRIILEEYQGDTLIRRAETHETLTWYFPREIHLLARTAGLHVQKEAARLGVDAPACTLEDASPQMVFFLTCSQAGTAGPSPCTQG